MKALLIVGLSVAAVTMPLRAQQTPAGSLTVEGGVAFINPGSPILPESEFNSRPIPRLPDGHVDLTGPWVGGGTVEDIGRDGGLQGDFPLLPWARELRDKRRRQDEPYTACLPMGPLRSNPYPWKFASSYTSKGLTHMYILHELGDAGNHRVVYMDGRKHPEDLIPTWTRRRRPAGVHLQRGQPVRPRRELPAWHRRRKQISRVRFAEPGLRTRSRT